MTEPEIRDINSERSFMRLLKVAFRPGTAIPMLALIAASGVNVALVIARVAWTRDVQYSFLIWNLFLAWLPLVFSLLACDAYRQQQPARWRFIGFATAWLLFFPNAPYICTDLTHLLSRFASRFWVDMVLILSCALTGLVLGFVSLFLMQTLVARRCGKLASWAFIACIAGLSGLGIYIGRFLRFNSWDVLVQPLALVKGVAALATSPPHPHSYAFPVLFATFLFITYVMLYALTHLRHALPEGQEPRPLVPSLG
jgi:uncharacterized membrane protein